MPRAKPEPKREKEQPVRLQKLLGQVAQYYRRRFGEEPRARQYLGERGIADKQALEVFGAGYADGSLNDVLPYDDEVLGDLKALGVLKENGKELLGECVTFPLWSMSGACVGLYGRRLFESDVRHLYLPGPRRGLVNWQAAKRAAKSGGELVLTESVLDALSLYVAGVADVIPCYGTGGFTDDHRVLLERFRPKLALCFDGDASGQAAAAKLASAQQLAAKGGGVRLVTLPPGTDPNSLLSAKGADGLRSLVLTQGETPRRSAASKPARSAPPPAPTTKPQPPFAAAPALPSPSEGAAHVADAGKAYEKTPHGFILFVEGRRYEVKAIARQGTQLRVTLKASKASEPDRFELSTVDLYSHRAREWFSGLCARLFGVSESLTGQDLAQVLERAERATGGDAKPKLAAIELTDRERAEALALLRRPTLMEDVLAAFDAVGYAGEPINKQLGYLVAVSRKLERPLSLLIESRSSAGKSALQDSILAFVPEEDVKKYSRITDHALFYSAEDSLENKLLVIEEAVGMGGAVYSIRALQSGDTLRVAATAKDPVSGKMRTEEYTVKVRTSVMMTNTRPDFDEETRSRFLVATVNESAELTRRILEVQRQADTFEGLVMRRRSERIARVHQNAQRLLRSLPVVNPYAPKLSFPAESLQARRDHKKYLGLIKVSALLHQAQREMKTGDVDGEAIEYIEANLQDIAIANRIAREVLTTRHGDVSPQARQLFTLVRKMLMNGGGHEKDETGRFTRRRLREHTGWSDWQVKTHLGELAELEYLHVRQGAFGKEYVYELADTHLLETVPGFGLTDVEALRAALVGERATTPPRPSSQSTFAVTAH